MTAPGDRPSRTAREALAGGVFLTILLLQFLVPVTRLVEPRPARFGWHMYSGVGDPLTVSVVIRPDSVLPVEFDDAVRNVRADLDYVPHLVPHLCRTVVGARGVTLARGGSAPAYVPCD